MLGSTDRLFVYGTLAPGRQNGHVLEGIPGTWEPAILRGKLVQGRRGSARGYPGVVLGRSADKIHGELFSSRKLSWHWKRLDKFEGNGYRRQTTSVFLGNGKTASVQVYVLRTPGT